MAKRMREKTEVIEKTRDRRPTAIARYVRIPSSKIDIVLDLVRGKGYNEAVAILKNTNKSASPVILKVLNSAAANAENNLNIMKDNLYIAECFATAGPTLKRMMPRARGRADRILKRTAHIRVTLDERLMNNVERVTKVKPSAGTKAEESKKEKAVDMKSPVNTKQANAKQKSNTPAKEVPTTQSERPLTNKPNEKKPLGTKESLAKPATKQTEKSAAPAKAAPKKAK